jgi:potassium voltage-gated channel Eag-related subfamily H protein 7
MFFVNRFVDLLFLGDMGVNFSLMFNDQKGNLVKDRRRIVKKYLYGWFMMDFFTILPYDSVKYVIKGGGNMMMLRLIRLARLVKLLRLLRASRIFQRWEIRIGMQHSTFLTIKLIVSLVALNHWLACCWGLTAFLQSKDTETWLTRWLEGQASTTPECTTDGGHLIANGAFRDECWYHTDVYIACLHWAMMTITSIGYGDIVPTNPFEYTACVLFMLLAGVSWAQIIGKICGIAAKCDPVEAAFYQRSDDINSLMCKMKTGSRLRQVCENLNPQLTFPLSLLFASVPAAGRARAGKPVQDRHVRRAKKEGSQNSQRHSGWRRGVQWRTFFPEPKYGALALEASSDRGREVSRSNCRKFKVKLFRAD